MALVAYDNSDVSESDEEESQSSSAKNTIAEVVTSSKQDDDTNVDSSNIADAETTLSSGGLFASLPTPRSRSGQGVTVDEEDDDFITIKSSIGSSIRHQKNKEGKPVRIVIPALSEVNQDVL